VGGSIVLADALVGGVGGSIVLADALVGGVGGRVVIAGATGQALAHDLDFFNTK
jgi:hypothetical protein